MPTFTDVINQHQAALEQLFGGVPITREKLTAFVRQQVDGLWKPQAQPFVFAGDTLYACPTRAELEALLKASVQDSPAYLSGVMDCDDFAWRLRVFANEHARILGRTASYAVGVVWRTRQTRAREGHAYNWAVIDQGNESLELVMIEPQNGTFRPLNRSIDCNLDLVCC